MSAHNEEPTESALRAGRGAAPAAPPTGAATPLTPPPAPAGAKVPVEPNKLGLEHLRLSQDFSAMAGVRKALLTVPVRKPNRQEFVRVRPGESWSLTVALLELKHDGGSGDTYVVDPALAWELPGDAKPHALVTTVNRQGVVFLWPCKLPQPDGRANEWAESALQAARMAESSWIKVVANMSLGAYEVFQATGQLPEPEWPVVSFEELVKIAFKGRLIDSPDHPVLRRLRGEA